mmetsp:Transcript_11973/g.20222  ORF Transcript_11973/g.20222 Transcript_11973/m.20222 type:complete len:409 (-) Transcript_11973:62-1288(-)
MPDAPGAASFPGQIDRCRWMEQHADRLLDKPLRKICLPGSHDSGAYFLEHRSVPGNTYPDWLCRLLNSWWLQCLAYPINSIALKWSITQRRDIAGQLRQGVRYFDLRVAQVDGDFHLVHTYLGPRLEPSLAQVEEFLSLHPHEVVLLDFNHLYCMHNLADHVALQQLVWRHLGKRLAGPAEFGLDATYRALQGKVMAFYAPCTRCPEATERARAASFHTGGLCSPWPRAANLDQLRAHLLRHTGQNSDEKDTFFVLQAVITPVGNTIASGLLWAPHHLEALSAPVTCFLQDLLRVRSVPCIVMVDFMCDGLADALIRSNFSPQQQQHQQHKVAAAKPNTGFDTMLDNAVTTRLLNRDTRMSVDHLVLQLDVPVVKHVVQRLSDEYSSKDSAKGSASKALRRVLQRVVS